jgi:hypothetical protein
VRDVSRLRETADAAHSPGRLPAAADIAAAGAIPVGVSNLPDAQVAAAARSADTTSDASETGVSSQGWEMLFAG